MTAATDEQLDAPIVAVTVYPGQARVTRRARVELVPGERQVRLGGLPVNLHPDSVRVAGRGSASVLGVDVRMARLARTPDAAITALTDQKRGLQARLDELADADRVEEDRIDYLRTLSRRGGREYAGTLATGTAQAQQAIALGQTIADELATALARRRDLAEQRRLAQEDHDRVERELSARRSPRAPDRREVVVDLDVTGSPVELEVSYLVDGAHWDSTYDLRLAGDRLTLAWFGLVSQNTGEDWPECDLRLSTARPAVAVEVPELEPWFLSKYEPPRPMPRAPMMQAAGYGAAPAAPGGAYDAVADMDVPDVRTEVAAVEHGATATTYKPSRPIAVAADGTAHRAAVATFELPVRLDYVTVPLRGVEAYLRATATNSSEHAILPGHAALFHEAEYVGSTDLPPWAPGEEVELALGVDDRVRVERELVRRSASKAALGGTERRELAYKITIGNYSPGAARITVQDQGPVSRDPAITVRDVTCQPRESERTELGVLTWRLEVPAGGKTEITIGFRVDVAKGVRMVGWRE
ncbi:DUF4139 domain-containing protein [Fodinicola acaciae]|uniref:DUF4139 domain-containing protein n=1 Tax=Fodinicola acaciae TaxID=2681555 RepID=UPI001C9E6D32|nr:DUF4139 domain-containing protein [Fodinicola acaciae]